MRNQSIIGISLMQTGIGLSLFATILLFTWFIILLLEKSFNIIFSISNDILSLAITIFVTMTIALYVYNSQKSEKEKDEKNKQLDLLGVLNEELIFLERNLESYKEVFSKEEHYPFYELWDINLSIYFNGLGHKIDNLKTIDLKKNLMIIKDKLIIINNMKNQAWKLEKEKDTNPLIKKIGAIKIIREQIIKIINDGILPIVKNSKDLLKERDKKR